MNLPAIWTGAGDISIPKSVVDISEMMPFAHGLTRKQQQQIVSAFKDLQAYDMAVEYAWRKVISRLKETLSTFGMQFIGEMLGRNDITDITPYDAVLTDIQAIQLAEQLGLISGTAALYLRHAQEIITHHFSNKADEDLDQLEALNIIKNSIKFVLGHGNMEVAIEFTSFRKKLLTDNLNDGQAELLAEAPVFYAKTVCFILLNSIRNDSGAKLEHALTNLNVILPRVWSKLDESDKYNVGMAYRDVVSDNNTNATNGLKQVLLKVNGFDFVPENLRSNTFIKAAQNVVAVHYAYDNFHNEPAAIRALANLGTTIPNPAFLYTIQAYLVVYIGSRYGVSREAIPTVKEKLAEISDDRWEYYFSKGITNDQEVLYHLSTAGQAERFGNLIAELELTKFTGLPKNNQILYKSIIDRKYSHTARIASDLYELVQGRK